MRDILNYLFEHKRLSMQEAEEILLEIAGGKHSDSEIAAFITAVSYTHLTLPTIYSV